MNHKLFLLTVCSLLCLGVSAQQRSAKRGMGWDEKTQTLSEATVGKMAPGVSWVYTWGAVPRAEVSNLTGGAEGMTFVPMCWNAAFDETALRTYLAAHPETQYLLAFNEPNLSAGVGGSQMTPQQAADAWPRVKQVAADFGLQIVAPALNFTGDAVGGRVWEPFAWYDEFFRLVPDANIDYLAFHSYMNWAEAVDWVSSRYFYTDNGDDDLYRPAQREKYPNLVGYLDTYKAAHGHFPRMFLTEFCSWGTNDYPYRAGITRDFQIDQMIQKLQYLEKSDLVAGYAWFMGNPSGGENEFPYMSIFKSNTPQSELSDLGKVYVYMSAFDAEKFYAPGETIAAKDYIDASMDDRQARVRPNSETASSQPLQVELPQSAFTTYQIDVPVAGDYELTLHAKSTADVSLRVYLDATKGANRLAQTTLPSTAGQWIDQTVSLTMPVGQHQLILYNMSDASLTLNALQLDGNASGIGAAASATNGQTRYFTPQGVCLPAPPRHGVYIERTVGSDGRVSVKKKSHF